MKRCAWTLLMAALAIANAGCMTEPKLPPHDPERLERLSEINVAVEVGIWEFPFFEIQSRTGTYKHEWSVQAQDQMMATVAKAFATDGPIVTPSDVRTHVPWRPARHALVDPNSVPDCMLTENAVVPRLEVGAIQTVKTTGERVFGAMVGTLHPLSWVMAPFIPTQWAGYFFGSGLTAVRFCLFEHGTSAPTWVYAEWFHGGLDLRDPANLEQLVSRAREHYRAALAKKKDR